jgi:alpha-L-rhamnosidase-like protein
MLFQMETSFVLRHLCSGRHSSRHLRNGFLDSWKSRRFLLPLLWMLAATSGAQDLEYGSNFLRVQMAADQPNFQSFSVDSLGKSKLGLNVMLPLAEPGRKYKVSRDGNTIEYRVAGAGGKPAAWSFLFNERGLVIRSSYSKKDSPQALILNFDPGRSHATLLGLLNDQGEMRLPALLNFPDHGTVRIISPASNNVPGVSAITLGYDATRGAENFIRISFPAASDRRPHVEYRMEVTAIYPDGPGIDNNSIYDGYRRDFLGILQINPRRRVLANNAASDAVAFTVFEYSMMAVRMPPLADGLTGSDILRQTLDRYVGGMKGYGIKHYDDMADLKYEYLDTYPSLVMATSDYVQASHDKEWLNRNYSVIKSWADKMIEFDLDGDGLMEYPLSGNAGSWKENWDVEEWPGDWTKIVSTLHPSNWWDTIGFGHKDAYSNALAYKAFKDMAELAREAGRSGDAQRYNSRAELLKAVYYRTFFNPATGVLAGWKSADGKLHDYYFTFVNGVAVTYGVVTPEQGNQIYNKLLAKMKEVGYDRFALGLPGNLVPIRREDYVVRQRDSGGSDKEDGSGGFPFYENGGATACYAYFTIQALKELGRTKEADAILFPMLKAFEDGGFQGYGPGGKSYDWKAWDGSPHGYEGLLVDGFLTLLAAAPPPK